MAREPQDPRTVHTDDDFGEQQIAYPGLTGAVEGEPDHGEDSYTGSGRLLDRRALVTGGDSGIGRAVSLAFAREGADVAVSFLPSETADATATAELIERAGRRSVLVPGDITDEQTCRDLVDTVRDRLDGIDIIVNNAAYQMNLDAGLSSLDTGQLERTFATNVYALLWICQQAVPHLRPGSSIINVTSIQASQPSPGLLDYAATKAAIVNITRNLGQGLADRGIRVNAVAPGPIWTPLIPATLPAEKVDEFGQDTPLGRAGQPAELAPTFVFLASDESSYITGETIAVTGGRPFTS